LRSLTAVPAGARRLFLLLLLGFAASLLLSTAVRAQPGTVPPSAFAGTISLNGEPIPTDQLQTLTLEAFVNGTECTGQPGQKFFFEEGGVTLYRMDVLAEEDRAGCGSPGDNVEFFINGEKAPQEATWELGRLIIVNLNLGTGEPTDIPTPTATLEGQEDDEPDTPPTRIVPTPASERAVVEESDSGDSGDDPSAAGGDSGGEDDGDTGDSGDDSSESSGDETAAAEDESGAESTDSDETRVESASATGEEESGFPVWAGILIAVAGVAVVGGGAGALLYKRMNGSTPPPSQPGT
jgi:hypothetical protein